MSDPRDLRFSFPLMRGDDVRAVQQALTIINTHPPCGTVDGIFGNATRLAVESFQRGEPGLGVDGTVGRLTRDALFSRALEIKNAGAAVGAGVGGNANQPAMLVQQTNSVPLIRANASKPPLNRAQALTCRDWLMQNFGPDIAQAVKGTQFDPLLLCAIAAKETGPEWMRWIGAHSKEEILARCVFDASGDFPETSRSAFPPNTAAFRKEYGDQLTADFIDEANRTRALRGWGPQQWVYKGYGIFQYDLQHIKADPDFFLKKQWRDFSACLDRVMKELRAKEQAAGGDLRGTVRRYNGGGERAETYADHVLTMFDWMKTP
ncbi:peptidoglycan-binding domain-containing protein [Niveibacterium sp. SC-1]|uniref:peptidoglycan-binding domain-containing protein n=1 Tax=Niveibacterium sp. SC-1 TaxID=3135646 RepID=UPI00311F6230